MDSLLLHIYDATDRSIRLTSWLRRNSWGANVYPVPIEGGLEGLRVALRDLVSAGKTFDRCLFETHGSEGQISFGHEALAMSNIDSWLANQGYDRLFPHRSRIYFNGCNIADNDKGWDFLDAAGRIFLRIGGGENLCSNPFWDSISVELAERSHISYRIPDLLFEMVSGRGVPRPCPRMTSRSAA